jgi:hypothetical protein
MRSARVASPLHTFATRLRRNHVPLEDIADLLGHELKGNTLRFVYADMYRLHEAVATLFRKSQTDTKNHTPVVLAFQQPESA